MGKQLQDIPRIGYVPDYNNTPDVLNDIGQADYFLQHFKTPQDVDEYKNYILHTQFGQLGVESPFQQTGELKAQFNPESKLPVFNPTDTPEQRLFKDISGRLIQNKGKLPEPTFFEKVIGSSMTAGWVKLLTGNEINGAYNGLYHGEDGFGYHGKKLSLTPEQNKTVADFIARVTGADSQDTFWDKTLQTATSLAFDLPLIALTGGLSSGLMKATTVGKALLNSTKLLPRLTGQVLQQSINFNLMGLPQTVEALRYDGVEGALNSIFHNVQMGALASVTGTAGVGIGKGIGKIMMSKNPALIEELSGLAGSFGFGYLSGKVSGSSDKDAISQGLAFAATHFTNPKAYGRVIKEIQSRNVKIALENVDNIRPITEQNPDYFIEKPDGKYYKIDTELFQNNGVIRETGTVPLEISDNNRSKFAYFNEIQNLHFLSYSQALERARKEKAGTELYNRWVKDLDKDFVDKYNPQLRGFAEMVSGIVIGEKLRKTFAKWELPQEKELNDKIITLANNFKLPYSDLKNFVVKNLPEYLADPEGFQATMEGKMLPEISKNLLPLLESGADAFIKQAQSLSGISQINIPLKTALEVGSKRSDILPTAAELALAKVEPERTPDKENIDATKRIATSKMLGDIEYDRLDINGKEVEVKKGANGLYTIRGSELEFKPNPDNFIKKDADGKYKTVKEIKKAANKEAGKDELEAGNKVEFTADGKKQTGKITAFTDEYKNANVKTEDNRVINVPVSSLEKSKGAKSDGQEKKVLDKTQPSETVAEVKEMPYKSGGKIEVAENSNEMNFAIRLKNDKVISDKSVLDHSKVVENYEKKIGRKLSDEELVSTGYEKEGKYYEFNDISFKPKPVKLTSETKSENASETTPISTIDKTIVPDTKTKPEETRAINAPKEDFKFEKSNLYNVVDNVSKDKSYVNSTQGKPAIIQLLNDLKDYARANKVPEKDVRDVAILALKKSGLRATEIAPLFRLTDDNVSPDIINNAVKRKSATYKNIVDDIVTRTAPDSYTNDIATTRAEELTAAKRDLTEREAISESYSQVGMTVSGKPQSTESKLKKVIEADDKVKSYIDENALDIMAKDNKDYMKAYKHFEGDEAAINALNIRKVGLNPRNMNDPTVRDLAMYETVKEVGAPLTPEQRQAHIQELNNKFADYGVKIKEETIDQTGAEPGMVRTAVTMVTPDGIEMRFDPEKVSSASFKHEEFHGYMTLADGKDRKLVDQVLKDYGWDGQDRNQSWIDAQENVIKALKGYRPSSSKLDFIKETWQKFSNLLHGKGFYSEAQLFRKLAAGDIQLKGDTDTVAKMYETIAKPIDNDTDIQFAERMAFDILRDKSIEKYGKKEELRTSMFKEKLFGGSKKFSEKILQSIIQSNNYANEKTYAENPITGEIEQVYKRPELHRLYKMLSDNLINKTKLDVNTILKDANGWNGGKPFRQLDNNSRKVQVNRSSYTSKIKNYEDNKYNESFKLKAPMKDLIKSRDQLGEEIKKIKELDENLQDKNALQELQNQHKLIKSEIKNMRKQMEAIYDDYKRDENGNVLETKRQAHDRIAQEIVGLTPAETEVHWKAQIAYDKALNHGYRGTIDMYSKLKDENGNYIVANGLNRKQLNKLFPELVNIKKDSEAYDKAKDIINADPEKRFEVAVMLADRSPFSSKDMPFYDSAVRPTLPSNWVIRGRNREGKEFYSYAENEKESFNTASEWVNKGYAITERFNIGKEISDKRYNKLTDYQLISLANSGFIPINNEIVQKLLEATKNGKFEQHTLEKKYVPGMHRTPKEYEQQVVNFVQEAVSASTRRYALDEAREFIRQRDVQINKQIKSGSLKDSEVAFEKNKSEWMHQFYNQVAQSDRSWADAARELATSYYIGFKPSFGFLQMIQPFQMALPEAIAHGKAEAWGKAFGTAWNLAYEIRARQKGESTNNVDEELFNIYSKLDKMDKMGATGIRELTGEAGDIRLHYGDDAYRGWKTFVKLGNMMGAVAEKYTRLHSLAQWYDIGKSKGLEGKALEDFIIENHDNVMSLWGASGRPVLGQSKELGVTQQKAIKAFSKSFFTFKTYTMANLGQYDRLMRNRQWGAIGAKMLVGTASHGLFAFPLMSSFFALANLLSDDDVEYEGLKALDEMNLGIAGRGVSAFTPIDVRAMLDERTAFLGDAFSETRSKSAEGKLLEAMLGAPYGVPKDMIDGGIALHKLVAEKISDDAMLTNNERDIALKNWSKLLPLTVRNIANGMRMATDGVELRGKELLKADDLSWMDVVYKMLGFNPTKVALTYENQFSGFPSKWVRAKGKIEELKKIRKEISSDDGYTPEERTNELKRVASLLRESMDEVSALRKESDYKNSVKQKLITP